MHTKINTQKELNFKSLPKKVSRRDFNRYVASVLNKPIKGPKPKLSLYKIFNYIVYVLHTGIQWDQLKARKNELHWPNVYKWHNRWSKDGSYQRLFEASVIHLKDTGQLDTSILHGDGSNTVVKKGDQESVIQAISTRRGKKSLQSWKITDL
jgi:transposase